MTARPWDDDILEESSRYADFIDLQDDPTWDAATENLWDENQDRITEESRAELAETYRGDEAA